MAMGVDEHSVFYRWRRSRPTAEHGDGRFIPPRRRSILDIAVIPKELPMRRKCIGFLVAAGLAAPGLAVSQDDFTFRIGRAPDWNLSAADGMCRLRIWVDDKAEVGLRGDQIMVKTRTGKRS